MKILVVEDEHKIANSIKKGLEQEKFTVDIAFDGEGGYDLASEGNYDVIILDLMLPKIDGTAVCNKLRLDGNHTPILILTAKDSLEDKVKGLNSGADDYLAKPFAFSELLARIRALSRRPKTMFNHSLSVGDLVLNTQTFEVARSGVNIQLSRKEYSLLEYLIRNKNKVVSKEQIINQVWDYEADILPNTVEVYVGYLRNKIDTPFKNKQSLIKTMRGFGYLISDNK